MTRWRKIGSTACGVLASICVAGMLLLTVGDIVLRTLFNYPLRGVYDLIELLLAGAFFLALPAVFLRDDNILVNTIDDFAPRMVPALKRFALVLAVGVFVVMTWQGFIAARDSFEFHDVTADLGLPRFWHWIFVLTGLIGATLAAIAMTFHREDRA